jgi:hypothetical protein
MLEFTRNSLDGRASNVYLLKRLAGDSGRHVTGKFSCRDCECMEPHPFVRYSVSLFLSRRPVALERS